MMPSEICRARAPTRRQRSPRSTIFKSNRVQLYRKKLRVSPSMSWTARSGFHGRSKSRLLHASYFSHVSPPRVSLDGSIDSRTSRQHVLPKLATPAEEHAQGSDPRCQQLKIRRDLVVRSSHQRRAVDLLGYCHRLLRTNPCGTGVFDVCGFGCDSAGDRWAKSFVSDVSRLFLRLACTNFAVAEYWAARFCPASVVRRSRRFSRSSTAIGEQPPILPFLFPVSTNLALAKGSAAIPDVVEVGSAWSQAWIWLSVGCSVSWATQPPFRSRTAQVNGIGRSGYVRLLTAPPPSPPSTCSCF